MSQKPDDKFVFNDVFIILFKLISSKYGNNKIFIFLKALQKRMENKEHQYLKSLKKVLLVVIGCEFLRFYLTWATHYASIISLLFKD